MSRGCLYYLNSGTILAGRYVIGEVLGFGGFGITYKAWDNALGTLVAVKEYFPAGLVQRTPGQREPIIYQGSRKTEYYIGLKRFLEEARNMAKFVNDPNIVHVENYFEENNTAYIVMEYLDGISLKDFLKQEHGRLDYETSVEIMLSVAAAVKELHKESILHRDISPDNIFICGDRVKLIDFGAARFADEEKEVTRSIILKLGFAPPEQYQKKSKQGPWTDVYALSATLYRLVTGVLPDESVNRVEKDEVLSPADIDSSIPEYLSKAIMRGMALTPELRFQSVEEFEEAIQARVKVRDPGSELRWRKLRRVIGIAAVVLTLLAGSLTVWNIYKSKKSQVVLEEVNLTIWLCIDESENAEEEKQMILEMSEKFLADQPAVALEVECIPAAEYNSRLEEAMGTEDMPELYESDCASQQVLDNAIEVSGVFDYLEYGQEEYYFLEAYREELGEGKQLPLGFNVPVAYVRRGKDSNFDSVEIESLEQISGDAEKGYYISPEYYGMVMNSFGGAYLYEGNTYMDATAENMLQDFVDGDVTYYLASVRELKEFNESAAGLYEMRPLGTDIIYGEFTDMWSIDGDTSAAERRAAQVLLSYMLAEGPQKTMHIAHKNSIPINKTAYQQFVANNGKYEIINSYLDKLMFSKDTYQVLRLE